MKKGLISDARIIFNHRLTDSHYLLECEIPQEITVVPGQFLELHLNKNLQFLRRPFSIFESRGKIIKILYKIRGGITNQLSHLRKGEQINLIYPLGNGFPKPESENIILISGGTGFAPLYFLAKINLVKRNNKVKFLIGTQGEEAKVFEKYVTDLGIEVMTATEDGSIGRQGLVTTLLEKIKVNDETTIYGAGPIEMLKKIYFFARKNKFQSYFSLESHFACGMGFCWGCVIETQKGFLRICKDGPVFKGDSILWEKL